MYLPLKAKQTAGYPRFEQPGVVNGYFIASYVPTQERVSLTKAQEFIDSSGMQLAAGAALVAGITALMF